MPAKNQKTNKGAALPDGPVALVHGDDDFAVNQRARQIYQGWCEALGGEDHEIVEAHAVSLVCKAVGLPFHVNATEVT